MSWSAIVGQALAVRLLRQAVGSGKLAHAYLFVGPEGVGKRTVAMELARALNCKAPGSEGACGHCKSCVKLVADPPSHPDLTLIEPDGRFIKTDQMRELQAEMYARPNEGAFRVAIINGADRLNPEAGNRVLKLLEEPPAYAVFLLLTHNLAGVLPTLISRCQVVNFPPLNPGAVADLLAQRLGCDLVQARVWASLSGGSIGRAIAMAQDPEINRRRDETYDLLCKIYEMDDISLIGYSETLEKQRDQLDEWLEMTIVWLRDALLVTQASPDALLINADRTANVQRLSETYGANTLIAMVDAVTGVRNHLQRNANTRLALDVLLLRLKDATQQAFRT